MQVRPIERCCKLVASSLHRPEATCGLRRQSCTRMVRAGVGDSDNKPFGDGRLARSTKAVDLVAVVSPGSSSDLSATGWSRESGPPTTAAGAYATLTERGRQRLRKATLTHCPASANTSSTGSQTRSGRRSPESGSGCLPAATLTSRKRLRGAVVLDRRELTAGHRRDEQPPGVTVWDNEIFSGSGRVCLRCGKAQPQ
jgi:hypothetical protein